MDDDIISIIDESIDLELNVSNLYSIFHKVFPDDASFWWKLEMEENNHAALIRSGKECFLPINKFPDGLLANSLRELKDTNRKIVSLIKKYEEIPPSREEALNIAIELENSAGELHFQYFMDQEVGPKINEIFKRLNKDDKDHAMRIRSYMESHEIQIQTKDK